ncbi:hypothetical protein [Epilithonimonas arachidiradicis]|uniref:N-acetyltransferase domain-containing protein n=1 Tax=Epilithonimonas arachidiradicis TaxID=1617282 RepID=A0A420CXR2_9FLAO|nr:hypothetical protein [Epilithonimonas arachidiradicis]RKE83092.1 hypothetical protein BXY58_2643 [Epilithonimonas arachidiradicis]GGG64925.1 hypothetical protein GCM10007332_29190 [Epilithonimonas arachidiradicis]
MNIISKFTVGSERGVDLLLELKEVQLKEMYQDLLDANELEIFLENELDRRTIINELNDLSTQLIIVFQEEKAVGYAILKNSFEQPKILEGQKAIQFSFFVLHDYHKSEVFQSLWEKCLSVTRNYSHWTEIPENDLLIPTLESFGFNISEQLLLKPFDLPGYVMIRKNY